MMFESYSTTGVPKMFPRVAASWAKCIASCSRGVIQR
jgi:hypothetical protein